MPELSALVRDEPEWLNITIGKNVPMKLAYHPARVTPLWLAETVRMDNPLILAEVLGEVISDWDIVEDGKPFPPTKENLATLPVKVLLEICNEFGDAATGSEEGNGSDASTGESPQASMTANSTGTRRNGSATSPLPASIG